MEIRYDVAIITPFYYGQEYIKNLVNSLSLNCDVRFQWIIVNDSPSVNIDLPIVDFDITVITNDKNSGIHQSRVNGLNKANSKYIIFLDQDDLLKANSLSKMIKAIGSYDLLVANGFDENSYSYGFIYHSKKHQEIVKELKYYYLIGNTIVSPGHCLIRKDAIPSLWCNNILKTNGSDDLLLWLLMLSLNKRVTCLYEDVYLHKNTGSNASLNYTKMQESTNQVIKILKENNLIELKYENLIKKRLRMKAMYEGKSKIDKILAYITNPKISYELLKLKLRK